MLNTRLSSAIFLSFAFHLSIALAVLCFFSWPESSKPIPATMIDLVKEPAKRVARSGGSQGSSGGRKKIDLRPPSMKEGFLAGSQAEEKTESISSFSADHLKLDSKSLVAFDLLASKIDQHLEFSNLLVENGVEGMASLELYFDGEGNIDELKSKFGGDSSLIRGVLVRAARAGLVKWYVYDSYRLKRAVSQPKLLCTIFYFGCIWRRESIGKNIA